MDKEKDFLNPAQVRAKEIEYQKEVEKKRLEYMDDEKHERYMRTMFQEEERTEHSGVPPAKDRIKNYKCRSIKRTIPSEAPN